MNDYQLASTYQNSMYNRYYDEIEHMKHEYEDRIRKLTDRLSEHLSMSPKSLIMIMSEEEILDHINIEVIEKYLRKKKLESIGTP